MKLVLALAAGLFALVVSGVLWMRLSPGDSPAPASPGSSHSDGHESAFAMDRNAIYKAQKEWLR